MWPIVLLLSLTHCAGAPPEHRDPAKSKGEAQNTPLKKNPALKAENVSRHKIDEDFKKAFPKLHRTLTHKARKIQPPPQPPKPNEKIKARLRPDIYKKIIHDSYVATNAQFTDIKDPRRPGLREFQYYMSMFVAADFELTRKTLIDPRNYKNLVPFVDHARFQKEQNDLDLAGGVMGFKMRSMIRFYEKSKEWIRFKIIGGSFVNMWGDIYFEDRGEKGTLVFMEGRRQGRRWPPTFVMTQGGEIVLSITARKMRKYIEKLGRTATERAAKKGPQKDESGRLPQPRSRY